MNRTLFNLSIKQYRYILTAYMLLILIGSSIPGSRIPDSRLFANDKLLHLIEYFLLGYFAAKGIGKRSFQGFLLSVSICLLMAGLDEFYQSFIPGRSPDILDFLADNIGIWLGAGFGISSNFGKRYD